MSTEVHGLQIVIFGLQNTKNKLISKMLRMVCSLFHLINGEMIILKLSELTIEKTGFIIMLRETQLYIMDLAKLMDGLLCTTNKFKMLFSSAHNGPLECSHQVVIMILLHKAMLSCYITTSWIELQLIHLWSNAVVEQQCWHPCQEENTTLESLTLTAVMKAINKSGR